MKALERLTKHLEKKPAELRGAKNQGLKIVGYIPTGYTPPELVRASGAVPVGLLRGGDPEPVAESAAYVPRFLDTFCRAQIGYRVLREEPLYQLIDMLVVAITETNLRVIADCYSFYTDVRVFRHGVPRIKDDLAFRYYVEGLNLLKAGLERHTGNKVNDEKLWESITSTNRLDELLREISLLRKKKAVPISGRDFVKLNHASYILGSDVMVACLESLLEELNHKPAIEQKGPRILLTGSTLAMGDYKIIDLVEKAGASIVAEEFSEGIRDYWNNIDIDGDPVTALASKSFMKRLSPAFIKGSDDERFESIMKMVNEFDVDGVIWYQLLYREAYEIQSIYIENRLKKEGIPMLKLESDYDVSEKGPFRTRIETFLGLIK